MAKANFQLPLALTLCTIKSDSNSTAKMIYKILKKPFFGSFMVKWRNPLTEDEKKEWQQISVKSKSGGVIQGLFANSKTENSKDSITIRERKISKRY